MPRPENGLPEDIRTHMRLMCDIVALAFQTDKTRVATLLLCRDLSGLFYPFLDVRTAHHPSSHDDQSDAYERSLALLRQPARLSRRAPGCNERRRANGPRQLLLDVRFQHVVRHRHDSTKVPLLLAGGLGGSLETGRVLDYTGKGDDQRKLCSLYLSLMDRIGVKQKRFGDAEERLAGLGDGDLSQA